MQTENKSSISAIIWHRNLIVIFSSFFFLTCVLFTSQSIANTNAKGIKIEFILDDVVSQELANTGQQIDGQNIHALTPLPENAPFDNNVWLRIQDGYAMPNIISPHTSKYEKSYASRPDYVEKMMSRSQKYIFYVLEEVEKRNMPTEIALLPMIESAYNPKAYSRSKALGIWQFMPATGKHFGLQQNWWVDNRRDVKAATDAALNYLEKLYGMFGSWDLALAAYNAGEGTVGRAILKNRKAGRPTNYQSLRLPLETTHYVPKLQAIKNIVTNPTHYGLYIAPIPNQAYFAEIDSPYQIDAKLAAKFAEISHEEFIALNPSYNRPVVASKNDSHTLLLPVSAVDTFQSNLNNYDKPLVSWRVYKAKSGENTAKIAKKFNISVNQLHRINDLPKRKKLSKNLHLLVPTNNTAPDKINVATLSKQKTKIERRYIRHVTHKIKRGETLSTLARKYGTNTRALMKINRLKSSRIKAGQIIRVQGKPKRTKTKRM
jgi:peptidoglycan lytic transglycosylase D